MDKCTALAKITSETVEITPSQARWMRDNCHFERQRNISAQNVDRLAREMVAGRFTPGTQVYICVLPSSRELIINGNHTLEAISKSGVPQRLTVTRHHVADMDEAGRVYAVFDLQKNRTWGDSLRASGAGYGVPHPTVILSAIGMIMSGFAPWKNTGASRLTRIDRMEEYKPAAILWGETVGRAPRPIHNMLKRVGIASVALETLRYQPNKAYDFWYRTAQDNGLTVGMPERTLLAWMRSAKQGGSAGQWQVTQSMAAALAWNAFFQGRDLKLIKTASMDKIYILGTPWTRDRDADR